MVLIPLKFVPALLLIGGVCLCFGGDDNWLPGLVMAAIGAVWSYAWYIAPNVKTS